MDDYNVSDYEINSGRKRRFSKVSTSDDHYDDYDDDDGDDYDNNDGDDYDVNNDNDNDKYNDYGEDINDDVEDSYEYENKPKNIDKREMHKLLPAKHAKLDIAEECTDNRSDNTNKTTTESNTNSQKGFGAKILEKFGHTLGKGLGKYEQGTVEPVEASDQKGKRGFGYHPKETIQSMEHSEEEKISVYEEPVWLENPFPYNLTRRELQKFMKPKTGPPKKHINDEVEFCKPEVLHSVLEAKEDLNDIENVARIRSRTNPFEAIRNGIFLNRAALKMANMDRVFDNMFTEPKDKNGVPVIGPYDLLYFADVCAGPGGFSEYVFYRKKWRAKGFGFTLRGENDFKLDEFFAGPCETFEPHYGEDVDGDGGDGDIFKPENIEKFTKFVLENTNSEGVHFMMADGGFHVDEHLIQEVISKQLYLCQCLVALKIVRKNGNFVVKLFDIFTPFSVGLIYLMYRSFDKISIHKPNSSRPASSERYLICQYKREEATEIAQYLTKINALLNERSSGGDDVLELVPKSFLKEDTNFFEYIKESNTRISGRQVPHLRNIVRYANTDACDDRQNSLKEECLRYWNIPNAARTDRKKGEPNRKIEQLFRSDDDFSDFLYKPAKEITSSSMLSSTLEKNSLDWYWMVVDSGKDSSTLKFYLGLGKTNVYSLEGRKWSIVDKLPNFQLPDGTLIYGEIVEENVFNPESLRGHYRVSAFHIVDGLFLGGEDIRHKHITERRKYCEMFAKSLTHSNIIYRVKELYEYTEFSEVLSSSLKLRTLKTKKQAYGFDISGNRFIIPKGLLFFCGTKDGWSRRKSVKENLDYYYNISERSSYWEKDVISTDSLEQGHRNQNKDVRADFKECFQKRLMFWVSNDDLAWWANQED